MATTLVFLLILFYATSSSVFYRSLVTSCITCIFVGKAILATNCIDITMLRTSNVIICRTPARTTCSCVYIS